MTPVASKEVRAKGKELDCSVSQGVVIAGGSNCGQAIVRGERFSISRGKGAQLIYSIPRPIGNSFSMIRIGAVCYSYHGLVPGRLTRKAKTRTEKNSFGCHGLDPWRFTRFQDSLKSKQALIVSHHGTSPLHVIIDNSVVAGSVSTTGQARWHRPKTKDQRPKR